MTDAHRLEFLDIVEKFEVFAPPVCLAVAFGLLLYLVATIYNGVYGFRLAGNVVEKARPTAKRSIVCCLLGAMFVITFLFMIFCDYGLFHQCFIKQYAGTEEFRQLRSPPFPPELYGNFGRVLLPLMFCFLVGGFLALLCGVGNIASAFRSFVIRQNGILAYLNPSSVFIPWNRVNRAVWYKPNTIRIELDHGSRKFSVHSIHVVQVTETLGRFVEVVDYETYQAAGKKEYPRPRYRFQFRLRTLMLVTLLLAVFSAALGSRLRDAMHMRHVCEELAKSGASVDRWGLAILYVGWPEDGRQPTDDDLAILEELDYVTEIRICGPRVTDAGLQHLRSLTTLQDLVLFKTKITDKGLEHVAPLERLEWLLICGSPITDAGLKNIEQLTSLWVLDLSGTNISDAGIAHLTKMPHMRRLGLNNTDITGEGLGYLESLKKLEKLSLVNSAITDEGLKEIAKLNNLTVLRLDGTRITDAGLKYLGQLQSLSVLSLENTKVTSQGLAGLKGLPELQCIELGGTMITEAAAAKVLPDVIFGSSCPSALSDSELNAFEKNE